MPFSRRDFLIASAALAIVPVTGSARAKRISSIVPTLDRGDMEQLDALIDAAVAQGNTPGIAFSLWRDGEEIHTRTAGLANLETATPVIGASVFRIGSLTKQFAAAIVLKLVAAGQISLADPARKFLPFLGKHEPFSVLELLNHTAGVHDGDDEIGKPQTLTQVELAERIAAQSQFFDFSPGTAWLYSNANYLLVGAIIEQVTGKPLAEVAGSLLFAPLSLRDTAFDAGSDVVAARASGYTPTGSSERPFQNAEYLDVTQAGAAGAMRSTASDLCRWHHALFHSRVLPAEFAAQMTMPGRLRNGELAGTHRFSENDKAMGDTQYGLGFMLDKATRDKSLIVSHHGGINGFAAYLATHVPSGLSYACLCNADTHPGLPFRDIRRKVFADILPAN